MNITTRKESVSMLEPTATRNIGRSDAVTFDKSPIDLGVVIAGRQASKLIVLNVNAATSLGLKIKGDKFFTAALIQSLSPDRARQPRYDEAILVNEYVPPADIHSGGPGDIFSDATETLVSNKARPRLLSSEIMTPHGRRIAYRFDTSALSSAPAPTLTIAPMVISPTRSDANQTTPNIGAFIPTFAETPPVQGNVFPNPKAPYYILVSFDAPETTQKTYSATLVVLFDEVKVEIPLSAQTGNIEVVLESPGAPAVALGDSVLLPLQLTNLGNMPAEVSFPAQTLNYGVSISPRVWTIPANQQAHVWLMVDTKITAFYSGLLPLSLTWQGSYGNNSTGNRTLKAGLNVAIKPPRVSIPTSVSALQGSDALLSVSITSKGPATILYFQAQGLPDGITMSPTAVSVQGGETMTTYLSLKVSKHAMVTTTKGAGLAFTVLYSAYGDLVKGSASVRLFVDNAFKIQAQQKPNWCWAAATASFLDYYGGLAEQCALADRFTRRPPGVSCCDKAFPEICNQGQAIDEVLSNLGLLAQVVGRALNLDEVIKQIEEDRPIAIRIDWSGGGSHAIAITGYVTTNAGDRLLIVEDPANGSSQTVIDIGTLTTKYRDSGTWQTSYLTLPPPPPVRVNTRNSV